MRALIHDRLAGKTVFAVLTNGQELIIQLTTGEEIVIGWSQIDGPAFLKQNVRIALPTMTLDGIIGVL